MPGPVLTHTLRRRLENRRNRPQARREPQPGRPRTEEERPRLRECDPGAGCKHTEMYRAFLCTPLRSHPQRGPCSALRCAHLVRIRNAAWGRFSSGFRPRT